LLDSLLSIFFWSFDEDHSVDEFPVWGTFEERDIQDDQGPSLRERTATIEPDMTHFRKSNIDPFPDTGVDDPLQSLTSGFVRKDQLGNGSPIEGSIVFEQVWTESLEDVGLYLWFLQFFVSQLVYIDDVGPEFGEHFCDRAFS
jgi:hypothetical protein